jgi:hypothetical protein
LEAKSSEEARASSPLPSFALAPSSEKSDYLQKLPDVVGWQLLAQQSALPVHGSPTLLQHRPRLQPTAGALQQADRFPQPGCPDTMQAGGGGASKSTLSGVSGTSASRGPASPSDALVLHAASASATEAVTRRRSMGPT